MESFVEYTKQVQGICGQKVNLDMDEVVAGYENDVPSIKLAEDIMSEVSKALAWT